jgi:hypothetical protein
MKTVIEMARQAGFEEGIAEFIGLPVFERFAELVRADEREACAKVCEEYDDEYDVHTKQTVEGIALQIRARGNT